MNGKTAVEKDFINIKFLDQFSSHSQSAQQIAMANQPHAEVWLGETSTAYNGGTPAYNGGTPGLSNTYIAGFM